MVETQEPTQESGAEPAPQSFSPLTTPTGNTTIADTVVSKIAGIAAKEVSGVHSVGGGSAVG
ncbi:MAG: Asp23/Gls24 family envelope stress response protein, partial [Mycobacteriaceae bacterium]